MIPAVLLVFIITDTSGFAKYGEVDMKMFYAKQGYTMDSCAMKAKEINRGMEVGDYQAYCAPNNNVIAKLQQGN